MDIKAFCKDTGLKLRATDNPAQYAECSGKSYKEITDILFKYCATRKPAFSFYTTNDDVKDVTYIVFYPRKRDK